MIPQEAATKFRCQRVILMNLDEQAALVQVDTPQGTVPLRPLARG
jgi:hypothetical protein